MTIRVYHPMNEMSLTPDEYSLATQLVERLPRMEIGDAILCTCGILWVTQEGDLEDYLLQKGDIFIAKRQGVVVIQALAEVTYRLLDRNKMRDGLPLGWNTMPSSLNREWDLENLFSSRQKRRIPFDLTSNCNDDPNRP